MRNQFCHQKSVTREINKCEQQSFKDNDFRQTKTNINEFLKQRDHIVNPWAQTRYLVPWWKSDID